MSLGRITIREMQHRKVRTFLTVMSVALGTAAVVSVLLTTATVRNAQSAMFATLIGKTDLEISGVGSTSFDQQLLTQVREVAGVKTAVPSISRSTILSTKDHKAKTLILGIDPSVDSTVREIEVTQGNFPTGGSELALDERFARTIDVKVGDEVKLLTRSGLKEWRVSGLVNPAGVSAIAQGGIIYAPLPTVQSQFGARNKLDKIEIVTEPESEIAQVQAVVTDLLPTGIVAKAPAQDNQMADQTMRAAELGLALAIGFALLIAVFTIFNTFQMVVGERRRQLGILRAIGATRNQIQGFILRESLFLGAIGTLAGFLLGIVGATFLTRATTRILQSPLPDPQLTIWPFALATLFGLGLSWIGAYLPAKRAGALSPAEAMQRVTTSEMSSKYGTWPWCGVVFLLIGIGLHVASNAQLLPMTWTIVGSITILIGTVFILPLLFVPASRFVQFFLRPIMGVESSLAYRQLLRHRSRTAMTASVLFIAIASGIGLGLTIMDNVRNVDIWCQRALVGDFFIRATMPDMRTGRSADLPDDMGERLQNIPGVTKITPLRFVSARTTENSVIVVVQNFRSADEFHFDIVEGDKRRFQEIFSSGEILIGSVLSERLNLKSGDTLPMETLEGDKEYKIAGVVNDYIGGGLTVYMDRQDAEAAFQVTGHDAYIVNTESAVRKDVEKQIEKICLEEGLLLQSNADLVNMIRSMSKGVNAGLWALLALGAAIASFGLVNTLSMNIIEQTREIGLLRTIAMTRSQVRKMVFAQALLLGIVGFIPGAIMGGIVAYLINVSTQTATGHPVELVLRPWFFLSAVAVALSMAIAASLLPAERAARVDLGTALGYE